MAVSTTEAKGSNTEAAIEGREKMKRPISENFSFGPNSFK
jgi:hypothetical protein